jgi:hypothetical protein
LYKDGKGIDENINLLQNIKSLQRDALIFKDDNERLMKYQEEQNGFNI